MSSSSEASHHVTSHHVTSGQGHRLRPVALFSYTNTPALHAHTIVRAHVYGGWVLEVPCYLVNTGHSGQHQHHNGETMRQTLEERFGLRSRDDIERKLTDHEPVSGIVVSPELAHALLDAAYNDHVYDGEDFEAIVAERGLTNEVDDLLAALPEDEPSSLTDHEPVIVDGAWEQPRPARELPAGMFFDTIGLADLVMAAGGIGAFALAVIVSMWNMA